mgnify:FL=1
MKKKNISLTILSLAISVQLGFAANLQEPVKNINEGILSDINSPENLKFERIEVIPGAFKNIVKDSAGNPRKLSIEELVLLNAQEQEHSAQRPKVSRKADFGNQYKTFDTLYNDKDEKSLKQIKNYNNEKTRSQGYFLGGRDKPLRVVSPYMKKNGQGEVKLTNLVDTPNYRTRADKNVADEKKLREYLDKNKGKGHDLYTARSKAEIKEFLDSFLKPIELIEYPINDPKNYKWISTTPGFPKRIPSFAKNIYMHSNPGFLQAGSHRQLAFGGTPEQLKSYIDEARINSKLVISKSDLENVYVKQYVDSDMTHADTLAQLLPKSMVLVESTTVPIEKFIQNRLDNPIDKTVDELYALENQVLTEFNKVKIDGEDRDAKFKRYIETRKRVEAEREKLKPKEIHNTRLSEDKVYPIYTEAENRKLQKQYLHRLSFNEDSVNIPDDYVIYLFDFGGTWNHPYALGAAVSPNKDYIIYFCQQG